MFFNVFFSIFGIIVALPILIFMLEVVFALLARNIIPHVVCDADPPRIAILVPAHNEERVIAKTLSNIQLQLKPTDRLIVVADNCNDKTVKISRQYGAIVLERKNLIKKGKGFALEYGVKYLMASPPDVLVIVDADCIVGEGVIERISRLSLSENRPVQSLYLMEYNSKSPNLKQRVAAFAWQVKNYVRPLGLKTLGLPCQLMGTGMAFPFKSLMGVQLGSSNIVEDMLLGIDLASHGYSPIFCPEVQVTSYFPEATQAEQSQRRRWEHGHLRLIAAYFPSLLFRSMTDRNFKLFVLVLDLAVPPLFFLAVFALLMVFVTGFSMFVFGTYFAFFLSLFALFMFVFSVFSAWVVYGRKFLSFWDVVSLPKVLLMKLPFYLNFFRNRQKHWERTERD